jgi:hypothetical protein
MLMPHVPELVTICVPLTVAVEPSCMFTAVESLYQVGIPLPSVPK